jgi:hypothetical protein
MGYSQFSATKAISGGALIAKLTTDNAILLTLFKQVAFDQNNKRGNFDYKNSLVFKLTGDEAAEIIRAIRTNGTMKFYHTFEDTKTNGQFNFYTVEAKGEYPARSGFGLSVTRGDLTVKIGFSLGAAERFSEYLKFCLTQSFWAAFDEDKLKDQEYLNSKKQPTPEPIKQKTKKIDPKEEPELAVAGAEEIDF